MSKIYRTAKGNYVNMDELRSANETKVAAGNMNINARGDELGSGGHIVRNVAERARAAQQNTKQTKTNVSLKPTITQSEKNLVEESVEAIEDNKPQEEIDQDGNITIKKPTRGKNKSESKSIEE